MVEGCDVRFVEHVRMYAHALRVRAGGREFCIPCEDVPGRPGVGVWLTGLDLPTAVSAAIPGIVRGLEVRVGRPFVVEGVAVSDER